MVILPNEESQTDRDDNGQDKDKKYFSKFLSQDFDLFSIFLRQLEEIFPSPIPTNSNLPTGIYRDKKNLKIKNEKTTYYHENILKQKKT